MVTKKQQIKTSSDEEDSLSEDTPRNEKETAKNKKPVIDQSITTDIKTASKTDDKSSSDSMNKNNFKGIKPKDTGEIDDSYDDDFNTSKASTSS